MHGVTIALFNHRFTILVLHLNMQLLMTSIVYFHHFCNLHGTYSLLLYEQLFVCCDLATSLLLPLLLAPLLVVEIKWLFVLFMLFMFT